MKRLFSSLMLCLALVPCMLGQIYTDRVLSIGRNALYYEDYVLSIQYFNEVIAVKPYLPEPYLYRSIAKIYLDDYLGASLDASECIDRNPFIATAWQVRGIARQNMREYDAAIGDFKKGLELQPENKTFLRALGVSYALKQEFETADSCFQHFIEIYPNEATAYMTRAQLKLELNDSITALQLLNRTIELDKGSAYAFALRSMILAQIGDQEEALDDMNRAIRLDPEQSSFYVNRALIHYNRESLREALADYDRAIEIEPANSAAHYNRGLLRAQVGDRNRAIDDFSAVIAEEPDNTFAFYNRALLRDEVGELQGAIDDYTAVYEQHPNFFPVLYARSEARRKLGQIKASDDDYKLAFAVERRVKEQHDKAAASDCSDAPQPEIADDELTDDERTRQESERNIRKFNRLVNTGVGDKSQRYSSELRGRVQDKHSAVEMQPMFVLSYYEKTDETRHNIFFEKNLSDFNRAGLLSRRLKVVCQEPMLTQSQVSAHFASIDDYSRMVGLSGGTIINFFGRSLDYQLVQDYQNAISDLTEVLLRKDNFLLAYFNRAVMRFRQLEVDERSGVAAARNSGDDELKNAALAGVGSQQGSSTSGLTIRINNTALTAQERARIEAEHHAQVRRVECEMAMRDLDKVIELAPQFVYAYYNRAFISAKLNNYEAALNDLNEAIRIHPQFAEAYYNRGLVLLRMGKTRAGIQDLSKAGELGLAQAYSVLKRAQD